jgi:tetratricopeptide (TPR) repeat protein
MGRGMMGRFFNWSLWAMVLVLGLGCSLSKDEPDECGKLKKKYQTLLVDDSWTADSEAAYKQCKVDLKKCPTLAAIYELMGEIDFKEEYYDDAKDNFKKALALDPDNLSVQQRINEIVEKERLEQEREMRLAREREEEEDRLRREDLRRDKEREWEQSRAEREQRMEAYRKQRELRRKKEEAERRKRRAKWRREREATRSKAW